MINVGIVPRSEDMMTVPPAGYKLSSLFGSLIPALPSVSVCTTVLLFHFFSNLKKEEKKPASFTRRFVCQITVSMDYNRLSFPSLIF